MQRAIHRSVKVLILALLLPLLPVVSPTANADFYNSSTLYLRDNPSLYHHLDQSNNGDVIATAEGCRDCFEMVDNGYAQVSTDGGATFTDITSIGAQSWRAIEVSSDGTTIVFFAATSFFISTNTGASFTQVNVFTATQLQNKSEIIDGALSGDGKVVFINDIRVAFQKYTYKTNLKRWTVDLSALNYAERMADTIATNFTGSKAIIGSNQTGLFLLSGSSLSLISNTETWNGEILQWQDVRMSDSGNEVIAFARIASRGGTVFKSNNGGASFSALTTISGGNIPSVASVEISGDGNAAFFSTSEFFNQWDKVTTLFTQHGKSSPWVAREIYRDVDGYIQMRSNFEGSTLVNTFGRGILRVFKGAPIAPTITDIAVTSYNSLTISWDSGIDVGSDSTQTPTDVLFEYSTSNTGPWSAYSDGVSGGNTGSSIVSGLTGRTTYYFRIKSRNSFGTSQYSEVRSGFTYAMPSTPPAPTLIDPGTIVDKGYILNPSTDLGGAPSYVDREWQYSLDAGQTWSPSSAAPFRATFGSIGQQSALLVTGITPGTTVSIRARFSNGVLWSDWSPATSGTFYSRPTAPRNLQVNTVLGTATLTWQPPADFGGLTYTRYTHGYRLSSGGSWSTGTTTETTTSISGLTIGTDYDFYVLAQTSANVNSLVTYSYKILTSTPAKKLVMNRNSAGAKSGMAFTTQPKISILDVSNNLVSVDSISTVYAQVNNGGKLVGADSATAVSGVVTFSNLGLSGVVGTTYTITYSSGDLTVATETATVTAGAKASMRFAQNTVGGTNGVTFPTQPQIELLDSEGNRVLWDDTTTVTMSTNNGNLGKSTTSSTAQASRGIAAFSGESIRATAGSPAVLTYSTSELTSIQETLTVIIGAASGFERITRAQDAYIGGIFGVQPTYRIRDIANNTVVTGDYYISILPSRGTLTGQTSVKAVDGVATFNSLGLVGVDAGQLVTLSVYSSGLTTYSGDSVVTRQGRARLSWSDFYLPRNTGTFSIPAPDSNTAGTFIYTSSNTGVLTISGSTATIVGAGTSTVTATFTPTSTTNFTSGETVTSTFTVSPSAGTLVVALSGGSTVAKGVIKTITATASDAGTVTFFINGKRVPGCIGVKTQSSVATCNWKPSAQGGATMSAILVPSNAQLNPVTSGTLNLAIGRRTGRR